MIKAREVAFLCLDALDEIEECRAEPDRIGRGRRCCRCLGHGKGQASAPFLDEISQPQAGGNR